MKADEERFDLRPVGVVESTLTEPAQAPLQADEGAPPARLRLDGSVAAAVEGLGVGDQVIVVTWLHLARRDVLQTRPRNDASRPLRGVFGTRGPDRPNPIGLHRATITAIEGAILVVDGLEAVDGTPILDIKIVI